MLLARQKMTEYANILILSAWGFTIVLSSFLFLYLGYWIDKICNTAPSFMFGLFLLGIMLGVGRLYQSAWTMRNDQKH
jgi:F0F1-type ATP synthase assembly protein I